MRSIICGYVLALLLQASMPAFAARSVNEQRAADLQGSIQISAVAGTVEVLGWDTPQVAVAGTLVDDADSVEIGGDAAHVTVSVRSNGGKHLISLGGDGPRLVIHVPARSSVSITLVSADFRTSGVTGDVELHTVSGDAKGEVGGSLRVSSVSGDVRLAAPAARDLAIRTVSGDIEVSGGDGTTDVSTVSGSGHITLGTQSHVHFKSTSGDMHLMLGLSPAGQVEGEAISGDISVTFRQPPAADFDVQTHSGDIDNCFGPKPEEPAHGPGQKLVFKNGAAGARVRIVTHSGDIELCSDKASAR